jgi:hypothetical protein
MCMCVHEQGACQHDECEWVLVHMEKSPTWSTCQLIAKIKACHKADIYMEALKMGQIPLPIKTS